jgi:nucleotide-binding universal stress UspA family protein
MYKKILVPMDGSKLGECALKHLKSVVEGRQGIEVMLINVLDSVMFNFPEMASSEEQTLEYIKRIRSQEAEARKKAEEFLKKAADILAKDGISAKYEKILPDSVAGVADTIIQFADKNRFDLIIISTHGRSGLSSLAFGSVANRVVHYAKCPVLSITPSGCRV